MKKVAIVGSAFTSKDAPYDDDSFEIWGLNGMEIPRATRWFEIHNYKFQKSNKTYHGKEIEDGYFKYLNELGVPVYMQDKIKEVEQSTKFPYEELRTKYRDYFTSTASFMLALALEEGFDVVHIYGMDMAQSEEYSTQRPSVEYWIGRLEQNGVDVYIPPQSDLLKVAYTYGYENASTMQKKFKSRQEELKSRVEQLEIEKESIINTYITDPQARQRLNEISYEKIFLDGCKKENEYISGVFL